MIHVFLQYKEANDLAVLDVHSLVHWLNRHVRVSSSTVMFHHEKREDTRNQQDARHFASIGRRRDGSYDIAYATVLNHLPPRARVGVLLHEFAHAVVGINGPDAESDADVWILATVPEAGYTYGTVEYTSLSGRRRTAKNIEMVSAAFVKTLNKED